MPQLAGEASASAGEKFAPIPAVRRYVKIASHVLFHVNELVGHHQGLAQIGENLNGSNTAVGSTLFEEA